MKEWGDKMTEAKRKTSKDRKICDHYRGSDQPSVKAGSTQGDMIQEYYVERFRKVAAERAERLAAVTTRKQALRLRAETRARLEAVFAPWPERTPLNPRIIGRIERRRYTIEKILFESRPGFIVSANLYVPRGKPPFPTVLAGCGHYNEGKAGPLYQRFSRGLAEHGYLVLFFDPVGQGERRQFDDLPKSQRPTNCVREHLILGKQLSLTGESLATWMVWDGIRALDYLLSRPEADPSCVGVTGNSGGGTFTTYLNAFDDRITMSAPSCFVTTYLHNLECELPADNEQIPPGIVGAGLELGDFFIAQAPRPTLLIGQHNDFFDERGLRQTFEETRRIYGLLDAADHMQLHVGPGIHGYQKDARQAMYRFFNQVSGKGESNRESPRPVEDEKTLWVTPRGRVSRLPGHRYLHQFACDMADAFAIRRPEKLSLPIALAKILQLPERTSSIPCHYRVLRPANPKANGGYSGGRDVMHPFTVETEPGIRCTLALWELRDKSSPAWRGQLDPPADLTLYLPHQSAEHDIANEEAPLRPRLLWTLEPRGMGRSTPQACYLGKNPFRPLGVDYFYTSQALLLGESYLGRRVHDVLATLDLLAARGVRRVHLTGRGMGAIPAAFAACLHPLVRRVTLRHAPRSFCDMLRDPVPLWPMSCMPWGVLRYFDLPDCYRFLSSKRLRLIEPREIPPI